MTAESSREKSNKNEESKTIDSEPTANSNEPANSDETANNDSQTEKKTSGKPSENAQSEDVEDVPQDFFDDFSNPDFMEGLNIVDAWDDEPEDDSKTKKGRGPEDKKRSPESRRTRRRRSLERRRHSRSRDRHRDSKDRNSKRSSSPKKEKSKGESDLRRDPAKSKRDLEKYKVRCDKDKEQKTITDKLKVVETGLVPPGMEMDVDLDEVMKQAKKVEKEKCPELDDQWQSNPATINSKIVYPDLKPSAVLPEKDLKKKRHHRSKSKEKSAKSLECETIGNSPLPDSGSERERRKSPDRARERRRRSSSGERGRRSHGERRRRATPDIRRSPLTHKRRSFERRSPSRERGRDRLRRAVRSRSRDRRSSSRGRRRRSRSLSEREAWIRDPKRAWRSSRSRSRSRSPKRKRHDDRKEKKISFLEEIHQLLTGTAQPAPSSTQHQPHPLHVAQPHHQMMGPAPTLIPVPTPGPVSIPLPVPPPVNRSFGFPGPTEPIPRPNVQFDMYDQQFFIGNNSGPKPIMPGPRPVNAPQPVPITGPQGIIPILPDPVPRPVPITGTKSSQNINTKNVTSTPSPVKQNTVMNKPESLQQTPLEKSLADLRNSIGAASSNKMAKEVKAAAKEEVKKLYEEKKISLSDFLSMTSKLEDFSSSSANLTKKIQVISRCQEVMKQLGEGRVTSGRLILPRTVKEKSPEADFISPLQRKSLVYKSTTPQKILRETFANKLNKLLVSSGLASDDILIGDKEHPSTPAAPAPPLIPKPRTSVTSMEPSRFLMKMVQTDPVKCKECEERNDIIYIHSASQCSVSVRSIGIQATEDPIKDILKNKPLAALTPAQLLMKEKEKERCFIPEERRLGYPGNHDFGLDRIINFRDGRSPPRTHYSPPRVPFSPPRRLGSPTPLDRAGPYVPSGPLKKDTLLPKRPLYPPQDYLFDDDPNRYFRR